MHVCLAAARPERQLLSPHPKVKKLTPSLAAPQRDEVLVKAAENQ